MLKLADAISCIVLLAAGADAGQWVLERRLLAVLVVAMCVCVWLLQLLYVFVALFFSLYLYVLYNCVRLV